MNKNINSLKKTLIRQRKINIIIKKKQVQLWPTFFYFVLEEYEIEGAQILIIGVVT